MNEWLVIYIMFSWMIIFIMVGMSAMPVNSEEYNQTIFNSSMLIFWAGIANAVITSLMINHIVIRTQTSMYNTFNVRKCVTLDKDDNDVIHTPTYAMKISGYPCIICPDKDGVYTQIECISKKD